MWWMGWVPWVSRECRRAEVRATHSDLEMAMHGGLRADSLAAAVQETECALRQVVADPSRTGRGHRRVSLYRNVVNAQIHYVATDNAGVGAEIWAKVYVCQSLAQDKTRRGLESTSECWGSAQQRVRRNGRSGVVPRLLT